MEKRLILYTFNYLTHFLSFFLLQIVHLKNVDVYTFGGGGGLRKYVLYTHLNVDNYGRSLIIVVAKPIYNLVF